MFSVENFLNDENQFLDFPMLLNRFVENKFDTDDSYHYFAACAKNKGILFDVNTFKGWFNERTPKKSDSGEKIFLNWHLLWIYLLSIQIIYLHTYIETEVLIFVI